MQRDASKEERRDRGRPFTVVIAMLANLAIAVAKFVAAAVSGSAAMFAEGVHSVVDTLNQGLLLFGAKRSLRPADETHPFGYGKEVYFWAMIYSVLLFGIGGGVSVFKGVSAVLNPEPPGELTWSYAVLAVALLAEGASWLVAVRTVHREGRARTFLRKLRRNSDPSRFVVVGEDSAALAGVLIAFAGLFLAQLTGSALPDAVASILIGAVLCVTAVLLTLRTKELLVGQPAAPDVVAGIRRIAEGTDGVRYTEPPLTMHLGPNVVLAALDVRFDRSMSASEVARAVDRIEDRIRERFPHIARIYVEAQLADRDVLREQPANAPERAAT